MKTTNGHNRKIKNLVGFRVKITDPVDGFSIRGTIRQVVPGDGEPNYFLMTEEKVGFAPQLDIFPGLSCLPAKVSTQVWPSKKKTKLTKVSFYCSVDDTVKELIDNVTEVDVSLKILAKRAWR